MFAIRLRSQTLEVPRRGEKTDKANSDSYCSSICVTPRGNDLCFLVIVVAVVVDVVVVLDDVVSVGCWLCRRRPCCCC